jgi:hypothetical protein
VSAHDQAAAIAHGDWSPPALFLDNGGKKLDLMGAVLIWVYRVGPELGRINQGIMGAVDFETHVRLSRVNLDRWRGNMRA